MQHHDSAVRGPLFYRVHEDLHRIQAGIRGDSNTTERFIAYYLDRPYVADLMTPPQFSFNAACGRMISRN